MHYLGELYLSFARKELEHPKVRYLVHISERLVYEDIYTSFHIRKYEIRTHVTSHGPEKVTNKIPHSEAHLLGNLEKKRIVMLGSWVETGDILVSKSTPQAMKESLYAPEDRLLRAILGIQASTSKETCLKLHIGGRKRGGSSYNPKTIRVYISQKHEIKVGDKVAGRHGKKGIISKKIPRQDMPYLQDRRFVDMVFNPSGKTSVSKSYEASKQTQNPWVVEPEYLGKSRIYDGRTGNPFEQPIKIGKPYILKLIRQVDDKIHGHCSGHYALVTQQPFRGRAKLGGSGSPGSTWFYYHWGTIPNPEDAPESFRLLVQELQSLALKLNLFLVSEKNFQIKKKQV
ncbi:hypothetical protein R3W88_033235 [Solanum pinnatisectum]|uniref:DNA-directed RNA polymerase n=1 Tax=Solanum pinnatisectum TaxID=50273 RepID=A0AAV9K3F9_9SOLN|nr:hypothetical protein R3W88_033235 [Solanum pinnatisectum]